MKRPSLLLVLLAAPLVLLGAASLGACSREASQTASTSTAASQPSAASQQPATDAAKAASQASASAAQAEAAPAATPSADSTADAQDQPGTASLERIAAMPSNEELPGGRWKAGENFDVISPEQPTSAAPGKVEVMEVFWLGCPHCYAFEPYIQSWLKQKPSYIQFVRVPVMWGPVHRLHAQLFYTLESLGRDDLVEKAFDTIHKDNNPLIGDTEQDTLEKQIEWAQANGIDPNAFRKAYNSFGVSTSLEQAQEITDRYHVEGVPEVIVAGKYSSDVGKAGGHTQLIQLMDDLAAFEHNRTHAG